ncbi:low molecular weight protein-tyrosine-phosphatase [Marinobacterium jannaschii]|uniref:low molecular weight protein-tyrosine-phosphatase n=1 Tax=Marinobacterium jannaschii TaxID=64970 RepID=UPI000480B114|nr:low molecular weight protein-tyrosine-phosphatase [Marinobacterium jannaschii]
MFNKILVVCVGNICRSPVGEYLLQDKLPSSFEVRSAGLGALVDKPMDPTSLELLNELGIDGSAHRAQQIDGTLIAWADLILVMEKGHLEALAVKAPQARGKIHLLMKWEDDKDIPDPYKQSREAFQHAITLIELGSSSWLKKLGI